MADLTGRCQNVEFCANAAAQRVITVPEADPFVCPKCGEPLIQSRLKRMSTKRQLTLGVQVLVLVAGAGAVAYKLTACATATPTPAIASTGTAMASAIPTAPAPSMPDTPAAPAPAPAVQDQAAAPPAAAPALAAVRATMLVRMAGSDVIAHKLARRLASGYLALIGDSDISLAQGDTPGSVAVVANQAGEHEGIAITDASSADGFNALLRGTADIALSTRPPNAAEVEQLAGLGDLTSAASEHVIAVQGVAAIVSPANHVTSLTVAQLHDIFTGKIHDWSQVGGAAGPIQVYLSDEPQGAHDTAADVVLAGDPPTSAAQRLQSAAIAGRVATDRTGIALVALPDAGNARILSVGEPGTVPVAPTDLSVSTEDYPLTRRLYFYNGASPSNVVRRFTDYVASPAGQAAVEAAGFIPLTVKAEAAAIPDTASSRFRALVAGATRLSVDFRFQPGSTTLDSRGARDLDRLVTYLRAQHASSGRLILAGFADGMGAPATNMAVSTKRTEAVAAALQAAGVTPAQAASFGAELPVADNATPAGRERNRRVEAYLANP